jgi:hypothetical protein
MGMVGSARIRLGFRAAGCGTSLDSPEHNMDSKHGQAARVRGFFESSIRKAAIVSS